METLVTIFKYLVLIVGIVFFITLLYAMVVGFFKSVIIDIKSRKAKKELDQALKEFSTFVEEAIAKKEAEEAEKKTKTTKKTVKKASKKKKSE